MSRQVVLLKSIPSGEPVISDFDFVEQPIGELAPELIRVEPIYFSVDPYLRARMSGKRDSYFIPFELGGPIASIGVGKVVASNNEKFAIGDNIVTELPWATSADVKAAAPGTGFFQKLQPDVAPETALSVLGLTGLTAYIGTLEVGKLETLKQGSTVLVSGAAGATGNVVGQIAKIKGFRVVGIAGSEDKVAWLRDELKFDHVINYKTVPSLTNAIKEACPNGIDFYFDNVGGETFDSVINLMNRFGVIVNCGAISTYNAVEKQVGPRIEWHMISKSLRMQGFIVSDSASSFGKAMQEMIGWLKDGSLKQKVTIFDKETGISAVPKGFISMMSGDNIGKSLVKFIQ